MGAIINSPLQTEFEAVNDGFIQALTEKISNIKSTNLSEKNKQF